MLPRTEGSKTKVVEDVTTKTDYAYDSVGRLVELKEDGVGVASLNTTPTATASVASIAKASLPQAMLIKSG